MELRTFPDPGPSEFAQISVKRPGTMTSTPVLVSALYMTLLRGVRESRPKTAQSGSVQIPYRPHGIVQIGDTLTEGVAARGNAHIGTG